MYFLLYFRLRRNAHTGLIKGDTLNEKCLTLLTGLAEMCRDSLSYLANKPVCSFHTLLSYGEQHLFTLPVRQHPPHSSREETIKSVCLSTSSSALLLKFDSFQ